MTIYPELLTILNRSMSINPDLKLVEKINPALHLLLRPDDVSTYYLSLVSYQVWKLW